MHRRLILISWQIFTFSLVASIGVIVVAWKLLPPEVPLWYGRPWGQDILAPKLGLSWIPIIITGMQLLGWVLSKIFNSDLLLSGMILATISVSQLVGTLSLLRIITMIL